MCFNVYHKHTLIFIDFSHLQYSFCRRFHSTAIYNLTTLTEPSPYNITCVHENYVVGIVFVYTGMDGIDGRGLHTKQCIVCSLNALISAAVVGMPYLTVHLLVNVSTVAQCQTIQMQHYILCVNVCGYVYISTCTLGVVHVDKAVYS